MERYSQLLGLGAVKCGGMILKVDRRSLWSKTCFSATLSDTNSTWIFLESNPGVLYERLDTTYLILRTTNTLNLKTFLRGSDFGCGTMAVYGCTFKNIP